MFNIFKLFAATIARRAANMALKAALVDQEMRRLQELRRRQGMGPGPLSEAGTGDSTVNNPDAEPGDTDKG